jgi:undecaprenyl-diphosphatase
MLQMPARRFFVANVLSALAWAPSIVLPGVAIGASLSLFGSAAQQLAILVLLVILLVWTTAWAVRMLIQRAPPALSGAAERLRAWANAHETPPRRILAALLDRSRPDARNLAILIALLIAAAWLFIGTLEDVATGDPLVRADQAVYQALQTLRTAPGDAVLIAITELGDTFVITAMTVTILLFLAWKRAWRAAAFWLIAVVGASLLNTAVKVALHRARPVDLAYTGWGAFSFPSGHSTTNAVLYGALILLIAREPRARSWLMVALAPVLLVALIAFSRLYLGAHWLSDVIGGLAFSATWLIALSLTALRQRMEPVGAGMLAAVALTTFVLAGGFHVSRNHAADVRRYAMQTVVPTMPADDWWTAGWQTLPTRRIELSGELGEPLTVQWAGELQGAEQILLTKGWQRPVPWSLPSTIAWLPPQVDPATLPVLPRFAAGRLPSLTLIQPIPGPPPGARYVLRFWAVDLRLTGAGMQPVWVGSVIREHFARPVSLFTLGWAQPDMNTPRDILASSLGNGRLVSLAGETVSRHWDAKLLLIRE